MSLESDLRTYLLAQAGLTALVGTRVYAVHLPQKPDYPNVVYSVIAHDPNATMDAAGTLHRDRFQFDVRAHGFEELLSVENQLVTALNSAVRRVNGFVCIHLSTEDMPYEPNVEAFRRVIDFALWSQP